MRVRFHHPAMRMFSRDVEAHGVARFSRLTLAQLEHLVNETGETPTVLVNVENREHHAALAALNRRNAEFWKARYA